MGCYKKKVGTNEQSVTGRAISQIPKEAQLVLHVNLSSFVITPE